MIKSPRFYVCVNKERRSRIEPSSYSGNAIGSRGGTRKMSLATTPRSPVRSIFDLFPAAAQQVRDARGRTNTRRLCAAQIGNFGELYLKVTFTLTATP